MHSVTLLSVLALVGTSFAAPVPEPDVVYVTKLSTVVVTEGAPAPTYAPQPPPAPYQPPQFNHSRRPRPSKPAVYTPVAPPSPPPPPPPAPPAPTSAPPPPPPAPTSAPPPPPPAPTSAPPKPSDPPAPAPPTGSSGDYMDIVGKWRTKMGLAALTKDAKLEANAMKTCVDGNGQMVHELNAGTMGQVLAPGGQNDFEKVFVGGWLCEVPSTKGLEGECSKYAGAWDYQGQTGHNKILVDPKYTKIGCALAKGIWGCDLA